MNVSQPLVFSTFWFLGIWRMCFLFLWKIFLEFYSRKLFPYSWCWFDLPVPTAIFWYAFSWYYQKNGKSVGWITVLPKKVVSLILLIFCVKMATTVSRTSHTLKIQFVLKIIPEARTTIIFATHRWEKTQRKNSGTKNQIQAVWLQSRCSINACWIEPEP